MAEPGRRVALVVASSTGGIGRHVASLAAGLVARGDQVTVYGPAATEEQFDFTGTGAAFTPVDMPGGVPADDEVGATSGRTEIQGRASAPAAVRALRKPLRAARPEVVHAHGLRAALVAAYARPGSTPLVVTWHNTALDGGLRGRVHRWAQRRVARAADVTLGASADLVTQARALGARDARLGAIAAPRLPAPARDAATVREELGAAEGQPVVLSVGRLHPQKDYPVLVAAAGRWRSRTPPPVVVIAGSGPSYLSLAAQISAARAPITLVGHRTDVADLLGAADLAVVTSVWEARQLFAQEALYAGVPLVATAVGGVPELVGDAAVLVPAQDVDALDAAVTELLDDPDRRAELSARGRVQARRWPTEQDTVEQVSAVYAELRSSRRAAAET